MGQSKAVVFINISSTKTRRVFPSAYALWETQPCGLETSLYSGYTLWHVLAFFAKAPGVARSTKTHPWHTGVFLPGLQRCDYLLYSFKIGFIV